MWEKIQKLLDRTESRLALYLTLGGSSVVGVITGWIASYSDWITQFGAIGWWFSGLLAMLMVALICLMAIQLRFSWVKSQVFREWRQRVDNFNPLDNEFNKLRIELSQLADPITNRIANKTITNCDLLGPANIVFLNKCNLSHLGFMNCDILAVKTGAFIQNAVGIENVTIIGGRIANATILVQEDMVSHFQAMGAPIATYVKSESTAAQS